MESQDLITVHTFPSDFEAQVMKAKLESEGIVCFLVNEHFSNLMPHLYQIMGSGVQLQVPTSQAQQALDLVRLTYPESSAKTCPNCGSQEVAVYRHNYWIGLSFIFTFFGMLFGNFLGRYQCKACHTIFRMS